MGIQSSSPSNESNTNEESVGICLFAGLSQQSAKKFSSSTVAQKRKVCFLKYAQRGRISMAERHVPHKKNE